MAEPRRGLLLDRDGVVNEETDYLHDPKDLVVIPGVPETLARVNRLGVPVAVVTNQAGIGRGMYDVAAYQSVNRAIEAELTKVRAHVDAWYFCPHPPWADCSCRKPRPGMLRQAASDLGLDLGGSILVGDKTSDLEAARAVGARTILVRTGYGRTVERELQASGRGDLVDHIADSLPDAWPVLLQWLDSGQMPQTGR
jgi:D-glycero-D-manno-heptose 1,7-bisphosphate phosphatase